jgi:GNAT superfamily N-acetyltransferase
MAFDVRAATEADRPDVTALIREMIPGVAADARLAWLYENNPAGRALTWIASEHGEVAGCTSYFPWRLQLDGRSVLGALGGDGYVRPKFRRRGLGGILHEAARAGMAQHGIGCMYGAPGAMNVTPLKHGGSREVGHVARWARPLRGAGIGIKQAPLDQLLGEVLKPRLTPQLEPMEPDDPRVDEVWSAFASTVRLAAHRDAEFYTWRFLDAPAQKEPAYVIVERGRPIGACAVEVMNEGRSLRIVDLIAVPGAWHRCLAAIVRHAAETTAVHFVDIKLFALDGRKRHMWRAGFLERDSKPFLAVIPVDGDRRFVDPTRWFYGGADSDLDSLDVPSVS